VTGFEKEQTHKEEKEENTKTENTQNKCLGENKPTHTNQGNQVQTDFATFSKEPQTVEKADENSKKDDEK
jgi:hypothetical protein